MKWEYSVADDGSSMEIIDHTGSVVTTVQNDGTGFEIPGDVLDAMFDTAMSEYKAGNLKEALTIVAIMAGEQIEQA
jgi:hypothetical protein